MLRRCVDAELVDAELVDSARFCLRPSLAVVNVTTAHDSSSVRNRFRDRRRINRQNMTARERAGIVGRAQADCLRLVEYIQAGPGRWNVVVSVPSSRLKTRAFGAPEGAWSSRARRANPS